VQMIDQHGSHGPQALSCVRCHPTVGHMR
jgi:hypothetical protein